MIRWALAVMAALWVSSAATPASAQICTGSFLSMLNFGSVDLTTGGSYPTSATLSIECHNGINGQQVSVCSSPGADGPFTMGGLGFRLYDPVSNSAFGFATTISIGSNGSGSSPSITVRGRLTAGQQALPPATYVASGQTLSFTYSVGSICPGTSGATVIVPAQAVYPPICTIDALPLDFGDLPSIASGADATTTVSAKCSAQWPYNILLDGGQVAASDMTKRKMAFSGNQITYGLFRDAPRSQPWGTTIGSNTVTGTGSGGTQTATVYGRIPPQPTPPPGLYQDMITVTVSY